MAVKLLGEIKLICSQMWRDKTLRKRFSPVISLNTVCVVVCVTLYFMPSPRGQDTKQTRVAISSSKFSFSDLGNST